MDMDKVDLRMDISKCCRPTKRSPLSRYKTSGRPPESMSGKQKTRIQRDFAPLEKKRDTEKRANSTQQADPV